MYSIFLDRLSGRTFVGDMDKVRLSLTILNDKISKYGELSANEYFEAVKLRPLYPAVTYLVLKNVMFQFYPGMIENVPVTVIDIENYDVLFDDDREEVQFV